MNKQPEWFERIKAVVREHLVAEVGLSLIDEATRAGKKPLPDPLKVSDLNKTRGHLEGTYLIRLFAVFESGLRDAWLNAFRRNTRPKTEDLLNAIAAIRRIPKEQLDHAHRVRRYRNAVVHEGNEMAEPISLEQAKSYLSQYFSWLPLTW